LGFILSGSILQGDQVVPAFKPPFDIIRRITQEARAYQQSIKKQAASVLPTTCPVLLPLLDELRTCFYEHRIEEIPALLVG
jgi:hypothetical protein